MSFLTLINFYGTTVFGFFDAVFAMSLLNVAFPDTKNLSRVVPFASVLIFLIAFSEQRASHALRLT